jgi:hypothetical protein
MRYAYGNVVIARPEQPLCIFGDPVRCIVKANLLEHRPADNEVALKRYRVVITTLRFRPGGPVQTVFQKEPPSRHNDTEFRSLREVVEVCGEFVRLPHVVMVEKGDELPF